MAYRAFTSCTRSFAGFLRCERGGGTIFGLFWFILLVGITGLAVDITDANRTQTMLQATADAASHAAVQDLPDEDAAVASALIYADKNMPFAEHGVILRAADVQVGVWDPATRTLALGSGQTPNAVLVTVRRTGANGNALGMNFLRIAGLSDWDIIAQSVAMAGVPNPCPNGEIIAAQWIYSGSTNDYLDGFCFHGQEGVTIGSTNSFEPGVGVTMFDVDTFVQGSDNVGIDEALGEWDYLPPLPPLVPGIVMGLMDQTGELPDYIVEGRPVVEVDVLPDNPSTDYVYIVKEKVDFDSDAIIDGLAVVSLEEIVVGSASTITNTLLASMGNVTLGSDMRLSNVIMGSRAMIKASSKNAYGSKTYCDDEDGEVQMFAMENIELGSQSEYSGVQIVSAQTVKLGSELISLVGISIQAAENVEWGSADTYGGCGGPITYAPPTAVYLVN